MRRRSASENIHLNPRATGTRRRKSDEIDSPTQTSTRLDARWWGSWKSLLDDHRRMHLSSSRCAPSQSFCINVARTTKTSLDVMLEKNIEDYWNVDGENQLSDAWTTFIRFILLNESYLMDLHGLVRDLQGNKKLLLLTIFGQTCGNLCPMQQRRKQNKDGPSRIQSSTMNQTMTQWKPLVESWKFQRLQQCLATHQWRAVERPTAILGNARQNTLLLLMPTKARDQGWKGVDTNITKIISLEKRWSHCSLVHKFIPMPQALKMPIAKAAVERESENRRKYRHGSWRKSETTKRWSMKQGIKAEKVHFASLMDLCHL